MQRLLFGALLLLFAGGAIASAFAAAPVTYVRDIVPPATVPPLVVIGIVSFPSGSFGGTPYPAQRFLVTLKDIYLLPSFGSNDTASGLWSMPASPPLSLNSRVAGLIKSDGSRVLLINGLPRHLMHFNIEDGTSFSFPITPLLANPISSLLVTPAGASFVLKNDQIWRIDIDDGSIQNALTIVGTGDGQLMGATALSLGPDGLVYALDLGNGRIQGFTQAGVYQRQFPLEAGVIVDTQQQFAVATDGRFYVGDGTGGGAVYAPSGTFLGTFTTPGTPTDPGLQGNNLISLDPDGTLLLMDTLWDTIHEFVPAPLATVSILLIIDNETIGNSIKSIQNISYNTPFCGDRSPSVCVNDDIANPGVRELLFTRGNDITPYSGLALPTGKRGDEGLFQFTNPDSQISQQNGATFTIQEFIFAQGAAANENNLDKISGVFPLTAAEILELEGQTVCAVVYDSDISYDKPAGFASLKGSTLGLTAFTVTAVTPVAKSLPKITVDLLPSSEVTSTCEAVLAPSL